MDPATTCELTNITEMIGIHNDGFLDLGELVRIVEPIRVKGTARGPLSGICIDTRKPMGEEDVFWAIEGRHFNGNDFAEDAIRAGVRAAVVSRDDLFDLPFSHETTLIQVPNTLDALQELAGVFRSRFRVPVVGITGSNGKTLVKEMLAGILCREMRTYRSPLSYNTQVGAALSILGMRADHQIGLIEAGISLPGEMERLQRMIRPDHGILTVISKAHIGGLGTLERTLQEKSRLFETLGKDSFVVINADDPLSMRLASRLTCRVVTFGLGDGADVRGEDVQPHAAQGYTFRIRLFGRGLDVFLPVQGRFNVPNALAAAAAATLLGASPDAVQRGLADFRPSPMRLEIHTTDFGVTLINDTYNSDPASIKGALDVLAKVGQGRRKVAILSEMLDLGPHSRDEHLKVGKDVVKAGVDHLITVGEHAAFIGQAAALEGMNSRRIANTRSYNEAAEELEKIIKTSDVVLFKGSRWFRLERIAKDLVGSIGPTRLVVNLDAISANINRIRSLVGDDVSIMTVVKSFGYGNDSLRTSRVALENGVNYLAVATPDEGAVLRQNRIEAPILVFNVLPEEVDKIARFRLSAVASSIETARSLAAVSTRNYRVPVHLKIDTGMGRSGVWVEDALPFVEAAFRLRTLEVEGILTHFSSADEPAADEYTLAQLDAFNWLLGQIRSRGYSFRYVHAANTAAVVRFPKAHFNMVRPGLGIYGMYPSKAVRELIHLEQVITFSTKIALIKEHPRGRCISYNRRFVTSKPCLIATIPVGYNDGYPRFQSNVGEVLVRGRRAPVVGTVCMDATMIDVTEVPDATIGDEVVLIGRQGDQEILADDIATNGGTINYEIVCKISPRVKRIFVQS
ncbi:MAG: alanine racemase [Thermodesulfobacteriota bacterium]